MDFTQTFTQIFHGQTYTITIQYGDSGFNLIAKETQSGLSWSGDFRNSYVEDITKKTGNFKRYDTFLKMLLTAFDGATRAVSVDILTYQDLEALKTRKGRAKNLAASTQSIQLADRRYLIITYEVEFDKVHYPLPLSKTEGLAQSRSNGKLNSMIRTLQEENTALRSGRSSLEPELARLEHQRELRELRTTNKELNEEINRIRNQMDTIITQVEAHSLSQQDLTSLQSRIEMLEDENTKLRRTHAQETDKLEAKVSRIETTNEKAKVRIRQLEQELEQAIRLRESRSRSSHATRYEKSTPISMKTEHTYSPSSREFRGSFQSTPDYQPSIKKAGKKSIRQSSRNQIQDIDERLRILQSLLNYK